MAEAKRPVNKDLRLNRRMPADKADFLQAKFSRQHNAGHPHLRGSFSPCEVMNAHLRTGMQRNIRNNPMKDLSKSQILHQNSIGPGFRGQSGRINRSSKFSIIDERIHRYIHPAVSKVTVTDRFFKFFRCKIMSAAPRVKISKTQIHRICAVLHGSNHRFR